MLSYYTVPFTKAYYIKLPGYCYHSVYVIKFVLAQSDHFKQLLHCVFKMASDRSVLANF